MANITIQNIADCESEQTIRFVYRILSFDLARIEMDETELFKVYFRNAEILLGECDFYGVLSVETENIFDALKLLEATDCKPIKFRPTAEVAGYENQTIIEFSLE